MLDSICVSVPDVAVGPLSGSILAILIGPDGMLEHRPPDEEPPPPDVAPLDELLELHAATPSASTDPTTMGRNLRRKPAMCDCPMCRSFRGRSWIWPLTIAFLA